MPTLQYGPIPAELIAMTENAKYKRGWTLRIIDVERDHVDIHGAAAGGLTLEVLARTDDAYSDGPRSVIHYFPVPAATYDQRSWRRWILDCLIKIETHEACEFLQIDGERCFAPNHGPGRNPYIIFDYATDEDKRTSFRGEVKKAKETD